MQSLPRCLIHRIDVTPTILPEGEILSQICKSEREKFGPWTSLAITIAAYSRGHFARSRQLCLLHLPLVRCLGRRFTHLLVDTSSTWQPHAPTCFFCLRLRASPQTAKPTDSVRSFHRCRDSRCVEPNLTGCKRPRSIGQAHWTSDRTPLVSCARRRTYSATLVIARCDACLFHGSVFAPC